MVYVIDRYITDISQNIRRCFACIDVLCIRTNQRPGVNTVYDQFKLNFELFLIISLWWSKFEKIDFSSTLYLHYLLFAYKNTVENAIVSLFTQHAHKQQHLVFKNCSASYCLPIFLKSN